MSAPLRLASPGSSSMLMNRTMVGVTDPAGRPARSTSLVSRSTASPYSFGLRKSGIQPSAKVAARRRAASEDPPAHTGTGGGAGSWR